MINVTVSTGSYIIEPRGNRPDGRVFIDIQRVDWLDDHDHPTGPRVVVDVDELFKDQVIRDPVRTGA